MIIVLDRSYSPFYIIAFGSVEVFPNSSVLGLQVNQTWAKNRQEDLYQRRMFVSLSSDYAHDNILSDKLLIGYAPTTT